MMPNRRTGALLAVLVSLTAAVLLAGCAQTPEPQALGSPSVSPSPSAPLPIGQSATIGGFEMTPDKVRERPGPVYDSQGKPMKGRGIKFTITVAKVREATLSGADAEFTVPVATVVDSNGRSLRMDDFFGMTAGDAQSAKYGHEYAASYQYACIEQPGSSTAASLWFSLPKGFVPQTLVIDGGAGQEAAWLLP
jgi:hypothetical protein